ncbi:ATP-binding cassette domain-containing protein [Rhodovulum sulfidophilum]|uniref:ATP-binding cassette domain-containing protein n=1 Tax=Rhodovulum sulfidophilum TaxID=35806 RepID=UPI001920C778|nr:ATP-binding cassette domain-containing protein [Rhodovulum sulfidophilum]MBL3574104.1 ATP-binding cassette domain-containing protein [Rhodovulum sulfidophilum]MCE8433413.1 ATP-binding cassette domain-containing protein [Rhodovulum sulfidophilum]MCF4117494.1 ATP-binding cassette domain-containing protein [Rhodovulum sulfidophilum]
MKGLRLQDIAIARGTEPLIAVDAHVAPGEVLSVMGPSGSGKSTLLAAVIGTLPPGFAMTGRVLLNGREVTGLPPEDRRIGILYQDELLFPHLSVGGNLAFALPRSLRGRNPRRARIEAALEEIGLPGFAKRDPATLSGGQKARVALMRMLLAEPEALLLDEPFSRLDTALRDQIRALVFARARDRGLPVLLVTHDRADAEAAGGPVIGLGA